MFKFCVYIDRKTEEKIIKNVKLHNIVNDKPSETVLDKSWDASDQYQRQH